MFVRLDYTRDIYLTIEVLDTTPAKKWLYTFNENRHKFNYSVNNLPTSKYTGLVPTIGKDEIVTKINYAIDMVNSSIKGATFPFRATNNMTWKESQEIHRAFTTSQITKKTFTHNFDKHQLFKYKFTSFDKMVKEVSSVVEKSFDIIDKETFTLYSGQINHLIHELEQFQPSERSDKLNDEYGSLIWTYHNWKVEDQTLAAAGINNPGTSKITCTIEELKESFEDDSWLDCDVFIFSNIFGKQYLETYLEYDPALELDVRNVQNIQGEFIIMNGFKNKRKNFFTNSPFSDWCDKYNLPEYITHPIPLGKVVGGSRKYSMMRIDNSHNGSRVYSNLLKGTTPKVSVLWSKNQKFNIAYE